MAYNLNTIDAKQFGLGPGTILVGPYNPAAAGGTPTVSVGAVSGQASLNPTRTVVPVMQGIPAREIDSFVTEEKLDVVFTGIQWNLAMIYRALGGGTLPTTSGAVTTYNFGGEMLMTDLALQFQHRLPNGSTVLLNVWQCRGNGAVPISIPADNIHQHSYTFTAVAGLSNWVNGALAAGADLWQMVYTAAP